LAGEAYNDNNYNKNNNNNYYYYYYNNDVGAGMRREDAMNSEFWELFRSDVAGAVRLLPALSLA
jgi:hypothetical protein